MSEKRELRIRGRAVSRGIGIGKAICVFGGRSQFLRTEIFDTQIESEISRFKSAAAAAEQKLIEEIEQARSTTRARAAELMEGHLLVLRDPTLEGSVLEAITAGRVNSEWAIQHSFDKISGTLKKLRDDHLRDKYLDLEDVAERLLAELSGGSELPELEKGSVVVASELRASTLLQLRDAEVAGVVTEHGGWTSHSSILVREFGIPCVTGIGQLFNYIDNKTVIAVNGNTGEVVFDPSSETLTSFNSSVQSSEAVLDPVGDADRALQTLDGRLIALRTNTTSQESYEAAKRSGARGIGLYRSEALIGKYGRIPTEDEQTDEYLRIAEATGSDSVCIRTFDIEVEARQKNPALGLRALRLGLQKPELFIPQIRALLRASIRGNIKIVIPMVADVTEIASVRQLLSEEAEKLKKLNIPTGEIEVGAMIEIPSAALLADQIAAASDFLCLGTNDLAQYVLAADRDNEAVSNWFRTLHPAMLRTVKMTIDACHAAKKPFIVCGEMAGSPFYVPVLIGMGANDLSIGPPSIEPVRRVVSGIAFEEAAALVDKLLGLSDPDEIEATVAETAKSSWLHLYPQGFFDQHGR